MQFYFINRILHKSTFYIALLMGTALSVYYLLADIYPNAKYGGTPYTRWIESFTGSELPNLLFMLMPIIAAVAVADIYISDKKSGFFEHIYSKGQVKRYFLNLYSYNFIGAGLCFIVPLLLNIYGCFMMLPSHKPDMIMDGNDTISLLHSMTLFPELYYMYPFLHMLLYLFIGFIATGLYATLALAFSMFIRYRFMVYISAYIINYLYVSFLPVSLLLTGSYTPTDFSRVTGASDGVSWQIGFSVLTMGIVLGTLIYFIGVKKNVVK